MGPIQRRLLKAVLTVVEFPRITLAACAFLLAVSVALAVTRLTIDTDQDKLFSSHVGFFRNYLDFIAKFPENEALYVLIEPSDRLHPPALSRWTAVADRIAERLTQESKVVSSVEYRTPLDALGSYALLFSDRKVLEQSFGEAQSELAPLAQLWGEKPGSLLGSLAASPTQRFLVEMNLA